MYHLLNSLTEIYVGFWWKPSHPWQAHTSAVNKIAFLFPNNRGPMYFMMRGGPGGPYRLCAMLSFSAMSNGHLPGSWGDDPGSRGSCGNVNSNMEVALGQWHRIEIYTKKSFSTTSKDGILKWWMDGTLIGDYSTVNFQTENWVEFQFAPTWGGIGETKTEDDFYWYDHVRISSGGIPGGGSLTPPAPPRGLRIKS